LPQIRKPRGGTFRSSAGKPQYLYFLKNLSKLQSFAPLSRKANAMKK
jgi:hypothetical protein